MGVNWNSLFPENKQTQEVLIVCVLSLLALATRAYGIWEWPIAGDEYFTNAWAEKRATGIVGSAYYALVLGSQAVFGATNWAARLPSVVLGVLSIPAFYLMCRSMFGRKAATIGCVFIILSEWHLYHSQIARFYSGVFLFGTISYHSYYLSLRRNRYIYLFYFFSSSIVAVSFHATAIFVVVSCATYSLLRVLDPRGGEAGLSRSMAKVHLLICVAAAVISLPIFFDIARSWSMNPRGSSVNTLRTVLGVVENMGFAVFVSAFLGLAYLCFESTQKLYLFSALIVVPLFSVFIFSVVLPPSRPRYMFYSLPVFFSLSAFFCDSLDSKIKNYVSIEAGTIIVISSFMAIGFLSYYSGRITLDIRDPIRFVEEEYRTDDTVVVFSYSIRDYLDEGIDVDKITKPAWKGGLVPVVEKEGRTWVIVDTYRTASLRRDLEAWLMENASLKWRKKETRFDYTQRGYEVWLEDDQ